MKLTLIGILISGLLLGQSLQASAQDYQSISYIDYDTFDDKAGNSNTFGIKTQYFFDKRQTLGPLNEFEFINKINNVTAGYFNMNSEWSFNNGYGQVESENNIIDVDGEWFMGSFLIGAGYAYTDSNYKNTSFSHSIDSNNFSLSAGYLFSDNLLVKVNVNKIEGMSSFTSLRVSYNWQLDDVDYVGFNYSTDEDLDFHNLSAKYFMMLADDSYLVLGAGYSYDNSSSYYQVNYWGMDVSYYFNIKTSLSASYDDYDSYSIGVNHFFNDNYAIGTYYSANNDTDDFDSYYVNFTAQF